MNSLKILLANSFNGFLIGWFGGIIISLAEIITSANTSVTNFDWLFFFSGCSGIFYLYFANLEEIKASKKTTIFIKISIICLAVFEAYCLSLSGLEEPLILQRQGLLYTKLYTGILGSVGGIIVSIAPLFLLILKRLNPLINQLIKIIQEELPGVVRKLIRVILYSLGLQSAQWLFSFFGLNLVDTLPPYTGLVGGALLGFNTPSSNELSLSKPDEIGQKTD
ncbi:hypothetical protein [Phormidium nigroviride]